MSKEMRTTISICILGALLFFLDCSNLFAAEKISEGRKLWDNILLWVNFGILVFLFMRFARKPLMQYLRGVGEKIKENIDGLNGDLDQMKTLADTEAKKLENIKERIDEIQAIILEMGNKEKERIVEQGKLAAEKMIEEAHTHASYRLAMAKKALSSDMVDMAISVVEEKLAQKMTEEDDEKILAQFIDNLKAPKPH